MAPLATAAADPEAGDPAAADPGEASVPVAVQTASWDATEAVAVDVMGAVNTAMARLVDAVSALLVDEGWVGAGIRSPRHWVTWKTGLSPRRAAGIVAVAERVGELPHCAELFRQGRLGEDAMVRIARRVPAEHDRQVADVAPLLLIPQLDRLLASLPHLELPEDAEQAPPRRSLTLAEDRDGWLRGRFCLPADEAALVRHGLHSARDAERRDSSDTVEGDGDGAGRRITWADALVRLAREGIDALDPTCARTGERGEQALVVLHHDVHADGTLGPGQLDLGPVVPRTLAEYLACDARVQVARKLAGRLTGLSPTARTVNRALRRYLHRRDQGCTHPLCTQRHRLHAHHIVHWEHGGPTTPANIVLLCPFHHRALHVGDFEIDGDPEVGTLAFRDRRGRPIVPPEPARPPAREASPPPHSRRYRPPLAEPLRGSAVTWN